MTNTISPLSQPPLPVEPANGGASNAQTKPSPASDPAAASQSDSVTLSAAAQATTALLGAAREASGVDQAAIDQIRGALANGSYNIAPGDLAQAIATVLKEIS
jgi:flagellar biosynthesis anti-sigma factor FlgM